MLQLTRPMAAPEFEMIPPRVGDEVFVPREVLAEVARAAPGVPPTWRHLDAGTRGKLIGWRDRPDEEPRAVIDVAGAERRLVVFVRERHVRCWRPAW